jgi:hypothetical protein
MNEFYINIVKMIILIAVPALLITSCVINKGENEERDYYSSSYVNYDYDREQDTHLYGDSF